MPNRKKQQLIDENGLLTRPFSCASEDCLVLANFYRHVLCDDLLPWWLRHAMDWDCGGIQTCIRDDGAIASSDKYVWSQTRALWTFAAACNRIKENDTWRDAASNLFRFNLKYGQRTQGDWNYRLARNGVVVEGPESIQTDAYAICALTEYARLTGSEEAIEAARRTCDAVLKKLRKPGSYATRPYPIPDGAKAQRVSMQFSLAFAELGKFLNDDDLLSEGMHLTDDVLNHFRRPEMEAIVEYLSLDNALLPPPAGSYMGPGHGIETAWFQIENLRGKCEPERIQKALDIMRWSFEKGWDAEFGGLLLGIDLEGGEPYLPHAEAKIWWPHCEALCGTLMAFEISRQTWCLDWYNKTHNWAFVHFPDQIHGEWTQRLDRRGKRMDTLVALPVKDPFHLPRALIYCVETLERIQGKGND